MLVEVLMSVNFMDVVAGDVVHLGGLQVVEIQTTGGRRFRILAGKHAGAKETRASALCDELIDNAWRPTHERFNDKTINGSLKKAAEWCARQE